MTAVVTREQEMKHADWMAAAEEEYRRLAEVLASLAPEDWRAPTDCSEWNVHQMVSHLVGAAESNARMRELVRIAWKGRSLRPGEPRIDAWNDVQVAERVDLTPEQLRHDLADAGARGVRARRRLPAPVRALRMPFGPPLGFRSMGYLMDRIYTRDAWMHRIDICRATGRPLAVTDDHDGRLVADVVAEWSDAHRQPYRLTLTGPAGGEFDAGSDGEQITTDAVEFVRTLAGRARGTGLLAHTIPF